MSDVLDEVKNILGKTEDAIASNKKESAEVSIAIAEQVKTIRDMAVANGKSVEEIAGSHTELGSKFEKMSTELAGHFEKHSELTKSVEGLNATLTEFKKDGSLLGAGDAPVDKTELKSRAVQYERSRYEYANSSNTSAQAFNEKSVDEAAVERYALIESAQKKMWRGQGQSLSSFLSPDELKAVSTVTHGDQFMMPVQMLPNRRISCLRDETSLAGRFDTFQMGAHTVIMPVDGVEPKAAAWQCEGKCEGADIDLDQQGTVSMTVGDLVANFCVTGTMLRDSVIDIEARAARNVNRSFDQAITNTYFSTGGGSMQGALDAGNHVVTHSTEALKITQLDILKLITGTPSQFQSGSTFIGDSKMAAYLATILDPMGNPIFTVGANGMPTLYNRPFELVDQMPEGFDAANALVGGSKPLAYVNFNDHYMFGVREDTRATRDAITGAGCDIVKWFFRQSVAGAVKCPGAFRVLKVKEA